MARLLLIYVYRNYDLAPKASFAPMKILNRECADFLVIDDDPAITQFLATYLKQKGHTCATLTDGFSNRRLAGAYTTAKWWWSI